MVHPTRRCHQGPLRRSTSVGRVSVVSAAVLLVDGGVLFPVSPPEQPARTTTATLTAAAIRTSRIRRPPDPAPEKSSGPYAGQRLAASPERGTCGLVIWSSARPGVGARGWRESSSEYVWESE